MFFKKGRSGYTLVEVIIASAVFTLFMSAALGLFLHSQKSINKASWINNANRDESMALRRISELAKSSSYPSITLENVLKIADSDDTYKAKLPAGTGELALNANTDTDILAFPICSGQSASKEGSVRWASLWLEPSIYAGYFNLILRISPEVTYNSSPPNYVEGMKNGEYTNSLAVAQKHSLLKNVEKTVIRTVENANDSVELIFTLSFPDNKNHKKEVKLLTTFNVLFE